MVPSPKIRGRFRRAMRGMLTEISATGFTATEAAFRWGEPWRRQLLAQLRSNQELIRSTIEGSATLSSTLQLVESPATYLAWIDVRRLSERRGGRLQEASIEAEALFRAYGVGVSPVSSALGSHLSICLVP